MQLFSDTSTIQPVIRLVTKIQKYIFGPLILFGGCGLLVYQYWYHQLCVVLVSLGLAAIVSPLLIIRQAATLMPDEVADKS